jgi:UDP-N-acetylglucosamine 2-epimerase (non-hydrolysing)
MSNVFFKELKIPKPDYNLDVGSGSHGKQTGEILVRMEEVLIQEKPDLVIVYGDTNSTLAGALATVKLHIPIAHVEAGLRSFDRTMPEEINRIVTDRLSALLFCPTHTAVDNLAQEGITNGVHLTGDVMVDVLKFNKEIAEERSHILERLHIRKKQYLVLTVHRPANTNNREHMEHIIGAVGEAGMPVIFPVHPRTQKYLEEYAMWDRLPQNIVVTESLGYLDLLKLMGHAFRILTDSGGIQKEAYLLGVPCITLRDVTEWVETVEAGWNVLVGVNRNKLLSAIRSQMTTKADNSIFGIGDASQRIMKAINVLK